MINCPNAIIRQCISNAYYNANSLIGYKLAYFRTSFGIDIFNCDIMSSIEKSKPNVLLDHIFTILLWLHALLLYHILSNVLISICVYTIVYE